MNGTRAPRRVLAVVMLAALVAAAVPGVAQAAEELDVAVELNGEPRELTPSAFRHEGLVFVPLREFVEHLGGRVEYHPAERRITVTRGSVTMVLSPDSPEAAVNGEVQALPAPPINVDGRVFFPARFVAEALGDSVEWIAQRSVLAVSSSYVDDAATGPEGYGDRAAVISYTEEELELLVRVINAEAYDEPYEGMVAVGAVVVNRVRSPAWPNTIYEVLTQPGQFAVIANGHVYRQVRPEAYLAAMDALRGVDPTNGALFFFNPRKTGKTPGSEILVTIGNHAFSR